MKVWLIVFIIPYLVRIIIGILFCLDIKSEKFWEFVKETASNAEFTDYLIFYGDFAYIGFVSIIIIIVIVMIKRKYKYNVVVPVLITESKESKVHIESKEDIESKG